MRIAVMGTGGVGGYFGASLAQAGSDVVFIARGAHLAAMRANGLRVESAGGDIVLPKVAATDDPASLAPVDVVMFCVKLWDVERGAAQIAPLVARGGVVIPFQNGIDSAEVLSAGAGCDARARRRRLHCRDRSVRRGSLRTWGRWRGCVSARSTTS